MIAKDKVKKYWENRAGEHGAKAVGYDNLPMSMLEVEDNERKEFIFKHCPRGIPTLDYGCGTGKYAQEFEFYTGLDITKTLIDVAREDNPKKRFFLIDDIKLPRTSVRFDMFFTVTVLQHNSDEGVMDIFESVKAVRPNNIMFSLYEIADVVAPHVCGRSAERYIEMLSKFYEIDNWEQFSHTLREQKHIHTMIGCA